AQEQVERGLPALVEARCQVDGPKYRIGSEKQTRVALQAAEAGISPVLPGVPCLQRDARIGRQVQDSGTTAPDLAIENQAPDAVVGTRQCSGRQSREVQEPAKG